jgi:hypothetical protein
MKKVSRARTQTQFISFGISTAIVHERNDISYRIAPFFANLEAFQPTMAGKCLLYCVNITIKKCNSNV